MAAWSLAVPDWRERIRTGRSLLPDLPHLDKGEAARAVAIFNKLRLPDVIGAPALAEAGADWFREIVGALHGSFDPAARERMIREIFLLAPKKSSKTSYAAALMVTTLLMNQRPRAEFLLVAPTVSLAHIAFSQALGMVDKDPDGFLRKRLHVQEHLRKITDRRTKATLEIKAFDTTVLTGVKPTGVLLDELHEIAKVSAAERIIGQLRGGLLPNPEGFLVFITTQSDEPPRGAFRAELMVARAIRDGKAQGAMLPVLYEFPEDIANDTADPPAWQDSSKWWMVTPNRDRSVTIKRLEDDWAQAKIKGQGEIVRWASQHLNVEIGLALRSDRWVGADLWQRAADRSLTLDALLDRSEVVVIGIDGGGLDDLLGLAALGRDSLTRQWLLWSRAWAHGSVLERRKGEASVLRDFEAAGELQIVAKMGEDIAEIAALAEQIDESGKLASVGLDPFGVGAIVDALAEVGIAGNDRVVGITQGWKLTGAIKTAERKLADGTLKHGGCGLMAWAVGNAKVEPRGNAIAITKQASGSAKIDPLMAAFNAVALMAMNPKSIGRSYLRSGEMLVL
ncbi:MAG: terminase large subunit [Bradyrhizobium sp.]|nr:terminase large subunit [Bradyrhizobium sp.]